MKKKICAGITILLATTALVFAATFAEQMQAKSAGYDWGYSNPKTSDSSRRTAAESRGYKNELKSFFVDGAKTGQSDKQAGKDYNNPYNTACYN